MKNYNGIIKLALLIVLLPIIAWQLGFKKTYELHRRCSSQKKVVEQSAVKQIDIQLEEPILGNAVLSNGRILQLLGDSLNVYHVEMVNYNPRIVDSEKCYSLCNGELYLSGGYINLVKILRVIESLKLPIKIRLSEFSYDKSSREGSRRVTLHLLLQQIEQQSEISIHGS